MLVQCALVKWNEFWVVTMTQKWLQAIFLVKHNPIEAMTWKKDFHVLLGKIM